MTLATPELEPDVDALDLLIQGAAGHVPDPIDPGTLHSDFAKVIRLQSRGVTIRFEGADRLTVRTATHEFEFLRKAEGTEWEPMECHSSAQGPRNGGEAHGGRYHTSHNTQIAAHGPPRGLCGDPAELEGNCHAEWQEQQNELKGALTWK